jgi:hypothetical protein
MLRHLASISWRRSFFALCLTLPFAVHAETAHFTVDAARNVHPISPYIYGINLPLDGQLARLTFRRVGGNRWTAYNWVNNASNAGSDFIFQNDNFLGGGNKPGGAVVDAIRNAAQRNAALLLTVPINGYVAADKKADGDVRDSGDNYLKTRFHQERAAKGAPFTLHPDPKTRFVYQDEFVNWVKVNYPDSQSRDSNRPIWFSLDNEPDLWAETHLEVHKDPVAYAELVQKTIDYAAGIKAVAPNTLVFGPVSYGWYGYVRLQGAPDAKDRDFLDFFLKKMRAAEADHGRRLLDVLDLHWYPEAQSSDNIRITENNISPSVVAARLQAPRSLWDANYKEHSWITEDWIGGAIRLVPLMLNKIKSRYPGTKLAFTEYNYGAGGHISGGIAQADVLGIFGRDGVFAANQWPLIDDERFVAGAFNMYRNFDGGGGAFGDRSVFAATDDVANTSIYASLDSRDPHRLVLVMINKSAHPIDAAVTLKNAPALRQAVVYQLTAASSSPQSAGTRAAGAKFSYTMPAYSVSTLELTD